MAVRKVATPLRELTCHMGSHSVSVTCHPAEVALPPVYLQCAGRSGDGSAAQRAVGDGRRRRGWRGRLDTDLMPRDHVDDGVLDQRREHEHQTDDHPHVDRLQPTNQQRIRIYQTPPPVWCCPLVGQSEYTPRCQIRAAPC